MKQLLELIQPRSMEDSYNRKVWLTSDDHSSAFIMCYYDNLCPNNRTKFFVRIGDCERIITIYESTLRKKRMISTLTNIINVLKGLRSSYTFKSSTHYFRIRLLEREEDKYFIVYTREIPPIPANFDLLNIKLLLAKYKNEYLEALKIHKDKYTCDEGTWQKKNTLIDELENFKKFIYSQV